MEGKSKLEDSFEYESILHLLNSRNEIRRRSIRQQSELHVEECSLTVLDCEKINCPHL